MSSCHFFSFRDKVLDLQMHELSSPSVLLHIFHLIWISSENIFLIQPRWSSKAWWSVLQPEGGQGKHSPWGETILKQFIWQVIYRRTVCNKQIEASCLLKIESDYITLRKDGHELGPDINQKKIYVLTLKIMREKQASTFNKATLIGTENERI